MYTTTQHRFSLEKGSRKHKCICGHKSLNLYVDNTTGNYINNKVGRCDRENKCCYHYTPKQYFFDKNISLPDKIKVFPVSCTKGKETGNEIEVSYLPFDLMDKSVTNHKKSSLYKFLLKIFREDVASWLCTNYFIGADKHGNTVFWQADINANIRQAKIMPYKDDGHRDKEKVLRSWIDKKTGEIQEIKEVFMAGKELLKNWKANLQQCFFGEYLLTLPENINKPVAIVESEKSAVIASVYFPQYVWIATGGKHGCKWTNYEVCKVLSGKKVILFPDLGAFETWGIKANELQEAAGCGVVVSNTIEIFASDNDIREGLDIADFLLRKTDCSELALTDGAYPAIWDYKY